MIETVLLLYNLPRSSSSDGMAESEAGVLDEVEAVSAGLKRLGLSYEARGLERLDDLPDLLRGRKGSVVFNLVEDFPGHSLESLALPALCRGLGIPCTGNSTETLVRALDKPFAKSLLRRAGLAVPEGILVCPHHPRSWTDLPPPPWIAKPARKDASEGIESPAIATQLQKLAEVVESLLERFAQPILVERYIEGRELNVSILETKGGAEVLPLAEIDFSAFSPGAPRIVDYAAKWLADSFAFHHTPRIIPAPLAEETARKAREAALEAWRALGCRGYARVDFRLDPSDRLHVLEVNPNPDISAEAGYTAALAAAGIPYEEFISNLLEVAVRRK